MKTKINLSQYKVVLYKLNPSTGLDFDIYDIVDFLGESLTDPDLITYPVTEDAVDKEIDTINKNIDNYYKRIKSQPETKGILAQPAKLEKNEVTKEYIFKSLVDFNSYWLQTVSADKGENVTKSIHWKAIPPVPTDMRLRSIAHNEYLKLKKNRFRNIINLSLYDLIKQNYVSEYDITDAVLSVTTHSVHGDKVSNTISFSLDLTKLFDLGLSYLQENYIIDFYVDFVESDESNNFLYGKYFGPSTQYELTEILTKFKDVSWNQYLNLCHTRYFLGFISNIEYNFNAGEIPSCTIICHGIGKILDRCNVVKNRGMMTHFEYYPLDLKQGEYTVFQDNLNNLSIHEIFERVLDGTLSLSPKTQGTYLDNVEILQTLIKDERLKEVRGITYTGNIIEGKSPREGKQIQGLNFFLRTKPDPKSSDFLRDFTSWSLLTFLFYKVKEKFKLQLEQTTLPKEKYIFADIAAIQEANEYTIRAYNLQVKTAHESFYSEYATGNSIFQDVSRYTYFDFFEEPDGVLVCRPARLNNFLETDSNFFIKLEDIFSINYSRSDMELLSRVDFSPVVPFAGQIHPFASNYINSQVLVKYGLNIPGSIETNPNFNKWNLGPHFAAVALEWRNCINRSLTVIVDGSKQYCLGRVYFIPDMHSETTGWIGRLISIEADYNIGEKVVTKTLTFDFVRRVKQVKT